MNLTDFIVKNNIKTKDGVDMPLDDETFFKHKLEEILFLVDKVPYFDDEEGKIKYFNSTLEVKVEFIWDKKEKKQKRKLWILRNTIFDSWAGDDSWQVKDEYELINQLLGDFEFNKFLSEKKLIFDGRYLRNFNLKRVIVDEEKVIEV